MKPPTFEEASKNITDPCYGIGIVTIWQLPPDWPGTKAAKIHDLRYDYLKPGEDTRSIDTEAEEGFIQEGCSGIMVGSFYRMMRLWGLIFQEGEHVCALTGTHTWRPCSYGQEGMTYDLRCSTCGLHKALENE